MKKFLILLLMIVGSANLFADQRNFVWTYQYMIMEPGEAELEEYTTFETVDTDDFGGTTTSKLNVEYEIGMGEHFDFAIYQNFKQKPGGSFSYDGFKLRTRIKIGEQDQFFLDPLIYLEYKMGAGLTSPTFEPKLILAKTLGNFTFSLNPYCEYEYEEDEEKWEFSTKYALGAAYEVHPLLSVGLEAKGSESGHYVGPTLSHGHKNMWWGIGALFGASGVKEGKPDLMIRAILGIHI